MATSLAAPPTQWQQRADSLVLHASLIRATALFIWTVTLATTSYDLYAAMPAAFAIPAGPIGRLLTSEAIGPFLIRIDVLTTLRWIGATLCVLAMCRPKSQLSVLLALFFVLALDSISKAFGGYANHAQATSALILALFALCGLPFEAPHRLLCGSVVDSPAQALTSRRQRYTAIVWLSALFLVVPYAYVAVHRLAVGGIAVFVDGVPREMVRSACLGSPTVLCEGAAPWLDVGPMPTILAGGFALMTVCELVGAVALLNRWACSAWMAVICGFHIFAYVAMGINFWENAALIVAICGPIVLGWVSLVPRGSHRGRRLGRWPTSGTVSQAK